MQFSDRIYRGFKGICSILTVYIYIGGLRGYAVFLPYIYIGGLRGYAVF